MSEKLEFLSEIFGWCWFGLSVLGVILWFYSQRGKPSVWLDAPTRNHRLNVWDVGIVGGLFFLSLTITQLIPIQKIFPAPSSATTEHTLTDSTAADDSEESDTRSAAGPVDTLTWQQQDAANLLMAAMQIITLIVIIAIASEKFDRSLAGFGLRPQPRIRDLWQAFVYYVPATGMTLGTLTLTVFVLGEENVPKHPFLEDLQNHPPILSVILLFALPVFLAPLAEELMFRGILQSFLVKIFTYAATNYQAAAPSPLPQSTTAITTADSTIATEPNSTQATVLPVIAPPTIPPRCRWAAIIVTSILFASLHPPTHCPALIILSIWLGYAYERRGNLWLCILMHSGFNLLPVVMTILGLG